MLLELHVVEGRTVGQRHDRVDGVADCFIRDRQFDRFVHRRVRDHDHFDLTQLNAVAAGFDHGIFAPDEEIIALLVGRDPVARAVEFFFPSVRKGGSE